MGREIKTRWAPSSTTVLKKKKEKKSIKMERVRISGCSQAAGGEVFRPGKGAAIPEIPRVVLISAADKSAAPVASLHATEKPLLEEKSRHGKGAETRRNILFYLFFLGKAGWGKKTKL